MTGATEQQLRPTPDLTHSASALWLWCVPACAAIAASVLEANHVVSLTAAGIVWTAATLWAGIGCALNAYHCRRVHCLIDGAMLPLLAVVGVLNVLGTLRFNWSTYWLIFLVILGASFVPEVLWKRYVSAGVLDRPL